MNITTKVNDYFGKNKGIMKINQNKHLRVIC